MKIAANYTIFYGEAFIEYSLRSIYPFVDYIFIALGKKSWTVGVEGKRYNRIDKVKEKIEHFMQNEDPKRKIILYEGDWKSDTEQRNFLLNRCRGLVDYAMIVDSDEVWEKDKLKKALEIVKSDPQTDVFACGIVHYYRSLCWRYGDIGAAVNYIWKVNDAINHQWIRHPYNTRDRKDAVTRKLPDEIYYHHYGYAYPSKIIKKKISFWGHCGEVTPGWFEDIFKKWKPGRPAWSPTGQDWTALKYDKPIKIMRNHPFAGLEVIP